MGEMTWGFGVLERWVLGGYSRSGFVGVGGSSCGQCTGTRTPGSPYTGGYTGTFLVKNVVYALSRKLHTLCVTV